MPEGTWGAWTASTATTALIYQTWTTANTTAPQAIAWAGWNRITGRPERPYPAPVVLTEQQEQERTQERRRADERWRNKQRERAAAAKRAERLLLATLNKDQRATWERDRTFVVSSADGERRYLIGPGITGNVARLGADGQPDARYCIHPRESLPEADVHLAQKLMLETDEAAFERIANVTQIRQAG